MFESQSNTPAEQDSTTPDPVRELLAKITKKDEAIADLEAQLASARADREYWFNRSSEHSTTIERAREAIEEVLAGDVNPQSTFDDFQTAFELLGVSLNREVEIEVTVTWRGTINLPNGMDPEDLDIDDFGVEINGHNEYDTDFYYGIYSHEIRER